MLFGCFERNHEVVVGCPAECREFPMLTCGSVIVDSTCLLGDWVQFPSRSRIFSGGKFSRFPW
jgi:hypothetical protein